MNSKKVTHSATNKFSPARIVKTLTDALMVKTGIKAGPEATFKP